VIYLIEKCFLDKDTTTKTGLTALIYACEHGHLEVVQYLIERERLDTVAENIGFTALRHASCNGRLPVVRYIVETCHVDAEGWNALHYASENGHLEVVEYLIESCNVDAEAKDNGGWTALHQAWKMVIWILLYI
jgi:ankyrin repeat protein